jgi:hypothetical protein
MERRHLTGPEVITAIARAAGAVEPIDPLNITDPDVQAAWWEFVEAAADERLRVWLLDANRDPQLTRTGYWIDQVVTRDPGPWAPWPFVDMHLYRCLRTEVEAIWPATREHQEKAKVSQESLNRALLELAERRGGKIKGGDRGAIDLLLSLGVDGPHSRQITAAFRSLPEQYRYGRGKPGK